MPRLEIASDTENEHSNGLAGEKEAKRQKSEPTTPVSTSSRQPYDYDALMGITRVGTREAEGFEEDLDSTEYHDATEEPARKEETQDNQPRSSDFRGGFGSSSLKECIELLNATVRNSPAPLDSGVGQEITDPSQVMSPNVEGPPAEAEEQPPDGSMSQATSQVKDELQSRTESLTVPEMKSEDSRPTLEVKSEQKESEVEKENTTSVKQEERTPEPDSEDSITAERVAEEIQRLSGTQDPKVSAQMPPEAEEEATPPPQTAPRERTFISEDSRAPGYGPYASQGARRLRGRHRSPDPFLFNTTIFLEHDPDASASRDDPMRQMQERLMCVEHNIETLRTRVTQVADLRDTQGIRADHRAIVSRLDEVEEYASANTLREFVTKMQRIESMVVNHGGGTVGEAIRVCTLRIDQQQALLDEI